MYTYRITIAYDGTRYRGWQRQHNTGLTVQGIIEEGIAAALEYPVQISGSGRTDSGVHAFAQEASLRTKSEIDVRKLQTELNQTLPKDIRILRIQKAANGFHARKSACGKCYEYHVDLGEKPDVFTRKYCFHFPKEVDIRKMRQAAELLEGRHNFAGFTDLKDSDDTVRTIYAIRIFREGDRLRLLFAGDGFLYHMVRILTGTLLDVGCGKISVSQIRPILRAQNRSWAGFPAPAKGLFLKQVYYREEEMPDWKEPVCQEEKAERIKIF